MRWKKKGLVPKFETALIEIAHDEQEHDTGEEIDQIHEGAPMYVA